MTSISRRFSRRRFWVRRKGLFPASADDGSFNFTSPNMGASFRVLVGLPLNAAFFFEVALLGARTGNTSGTAEKLGKTSGRKSGTESAAFSASAAHVDGWALISQKPVAKPLTTGVAILEGRARPDDFFAHSTGEWTFEDGLVIKLTFELVCVAV